VQLHPTSLPGGRLGPEAFEFVDWLAAAGASWWQVLPLNPPDELGSPYAAASAFASWRGLLAEPDAPVGTNEARAFRERERAWIDAWASFAGEGAVEDQVRFEREWAALRSHAASRGVRIIGDVPIYVAVGGCDHTLHPELFLPVEEVVAGAPPDDMNELGQLWGNPLFDWEAMERSLLEQALAQSGGNRAAASRLLGLSYKQFLYRLDKHGIAAVEERAEEGRVLPK